MFKVNNKDTDPIFLAPIPADVVTFSEEILNRKLHFLCSGGNRVVFQRLLYKKQFYCTSGENVPKNPDTSHYFFQQLLHYYVC